MTPYITFNVDAFNIVLNPDEPQAFRKAVYRQLVSTLGDELGHIYVNLFQPVESLYWNYHVNNDNLEGVGHGRFNPSGIKANLFQSKIDFFLTLNAVSFMP